jgi:leucyl aminopeptidase (aminopeptidase T)
LRARRGTLKKAYPKTKRAARETAKDIARSQARMASSANKLAKTTVRQTSRSATRARKTAVAIIRWPYVRFVRLLRLARYGVATRILGRR